MKSKREKSQAFSEKMIFWSFIGMAAIFALLALGVLLEHLILGVI